MRHRRLAAALAVGLTFGVSASAHAADPGSPVIGINAGYLGHTTLTKDHFAYSVPSGTVIHDSVVLTDFSDQPIDVALYGADALEATGGGIAPAQPYQAMVGVGHWLSLQSATVHLAAKSKAADPFTLAVPAGLPPGDYLGAVVASIARPSSPVGGMAVATRLALTVDLSVPGTMNLDLVVGALSESDGAGHKSFTTTVRNSGNVLAVLTGAITIRDVFGNLTERLPLLPDGIYVIPNGQAELSSDWSDLPLAGIYTATATLDATAGSQDLGLSAAPITVAVVPFAQLAILGGLLVVVLVKRRSIAAWVSDRRAERRDVAEFKRRRRTNRNS